MGAIFGAVWYQRDNITEIQNKMQKCLAFRYVDFQNRFILKSEFLGAAGWLERDAGLFQMNGCVAVYEGEIYNISDLYDRFFPEHKSMQQQDELAAIVLLYKKFSLDFPKYLNGVFTIALWDTEIQKLFLCRDHVGSHSLFYSITSHGVFFSSTINSLLATGVVSSEISVSAVNQYFASKALSPPSTMYKAVLAVRAAHVISIDGKNVDEHDYWKLHEIDVDDTIKTNDYVDQLRHTIFNAIDIRATYSYPYGTVVSGGLDTGIVTATLARKQQGNRLDAFSVAFAERSFSDDPLQQLMVQKFSLNHHQAVLGPDEFSRILGDSVRHLDSPVNDIAFVGMAKVFELARQKGYRVIFEGEGPDEIFPAGNTHGERQLSKFLLIPFVMRRKLLGAFFHTMPLGDSLFAKAARMLTRIAMDDEERCLTWRTYFHNNLRKQLLSQDWYEDADPYVHQRPYIAECKNSDPINRYQFGLIKTFLTDNLLFKDERMAASQGIINRVPLIDYRLVELALKIPSFLQISKPDETKDGIKQLYKNALHGYIPRQILEHKKIRGFSHPTSEWFKGELKDYVMDILLGETARKRGIVNPKYVERLVAEHIAGKANYDYPLNSLLVFELWMQKNFDTLNAAHG